MNNDNNLTILHQLTISTVKERFVTHQWLKVCMDSSMKKVIQELESTSLLFRATSLWTQMKQILTKMIAFSRGLLSIICEGSTQLFEYSNIIRLQTLNTNIIITYNGHEQNYSINLINVLYCSRLPHTLNIK